MDTVFLRHPDLFWALPAALAVILVWRRLRRRRSVAWTTVRWLNQPLYHPSAVRHLPAVCLLAALACISVALTDPVLSYSEGRMEARGLDIALVLDLSDSMQDTMGPLYGKFLAPVTTDAKTRLATTKEVMKAFIVKRRDDRLGLVVFSNNAYLVSPLTFDRDYLLHYVDMVDEKILRGEGMTAIGDGITLANSLLLKQSKNSGRHQQVIVVFTDGESNMGRDPVQAIAEAAERGVKLYMVGVVMAVQMQKPAVQQVVTAVHRHGGRFYNAETEGELHAASATIDRLEKGFLTNKVSIRNAPVFQWFALPALILLVLGAGLRAVPYFVDVT